MTPKQAAERILELDKETTPGPWESRQDYDYYQGGTYLGVGRCDNYNRGQKAACSDSDGGYFETNVCRIEKDTDENFIKETRTLAPQVAKSLLEALDIIESLQIKKVEK